MPLLLHFVPSMKKHVSHPASHPVGICNLLLITGLISPLTSITWSKGRASFRINYVLLNIDILQSHNLWAGGWSTVKSWNCSSHIFRVGLFDYIYSGNRREKCPLALQALITLSCMVLLQKWPPDGSISLYGKTSTVKRELWMEAVFRNLKKNTYIILHKGTKVSSTKCIKSFKSKNLSHRKITRITKFHIIYW